MFDLIPLDNEIPKGNNSLGSFALYYQRAKYYDYSTELVEKDVSVDGKLKFSFINTLGDGKDYGKVDNQGNYILLDLNNGKNYSTIRIQNKNITGIDLFNIFAKDLINDYNNFIQLYRIPPDSLFTSLEVKQSQINHQFIYNTHISSLLEKWKLIFNFPELYKEVNDIKSLIRFCLNYIKEYSTTRPVTKIGFAGSKYYSSNNTGLCLQIGTTDPSDDLKKYQTILKDPVFNLFADFARRKGFMIDKVNPYNLFLDFNNKYFLNTIKNDPNETYKINSNTTFDFKNVDEFLEKRYVRADKYDYDNLLTNVVKMVNEFANSDLTKEKPKYCFQDEQTYVKFKQLNIPVLQQKEDVLRYITTSEFIQQYIEIRCNEIGLFLDKKQVIKIVNKFIDEYKVIGQEKAIYKINDTLKTLKIQLDKPM